MIKWFKREHVHKYKQVYNVFGVSTKSYFEKCSCGKERSVSFTWQGSNEGRVEVKYSDHKVEELK